MRRRSREVDLEHLQRLVDLERSGLKQGVINAIAELPPTRASLVLPTPEPMEASTSESVAVAVAAMALAPAAASEAVVVSVPEPTAASAPAAASTAAASPAPEPAAAPAPEPAAAPVTVREVTVLVRQEGDRRSFKIDANEKARALYERVASEFGHSPEMVELKRGGLGDAPPLNSDDTLIVQGVCDRDCLLCSRRESTDVVPADAADAADAADVVADGSASDGARDEGSSGDAAARRLRAAMAKEHAMQEVRASAERHAAAATAPGGGEAADASGAPSGPRASHECVRCHLPRADTYPMLGDGRPCWRGETEDAKHWYCGACLVDHIHCNGPTCLMCSQSFAQTYTVGVGASLVPEKLRGERCVVCNGADFIEVNPLIICSCVKCQEAPPERRKAVHLKCTDCRGWYKMWEVVPDGDVYFCDAADPDGTHAPDQLCPGDRVFVYREDDPPELNEAVVAPDEPDAAPDEPAAAPDEHDDGESDPEPDDAGGAAPVPAAAAAAAADAGADVSRGETLENRGATTVALHRFEETVGPLRGLAAAKESFREILTDLLYKRFGRHQAEGPVNNNIILRGNPGVGKTTLVRALYEALHAAGVLARDGRFVEIKANALRKPGAVAAAMKQAAGGMLFIDEAYTLRTCEGTNNDLNNAIDPRGGLPLVVVAGYPEEMNRWLINNPKCNVGLISRFAREIEIANYTHDELVAIMHVMLKRQEVATYTDDALALLRRAARGIASDERSNNARDMEQILQSVKRKWIASVGIHQYDREVKWDAQLVREGIEAWTQSRRRDCSAHPPPVRRGACGTPGGKRVVSCSSAALVLSDGTSEPVGALGDAGPTTTGETSSASTSSSTAPVPAPLAAPDVAEAAAESGVEATSAEAMAAEEAAAEAETAVAMEAGTVVVANDALIDAVRQVVDQMRPESGRFVGLRLILNRVREVIGDDAWHAAGGPQIVRPGVETSNFYKRIVGILEGLTGTPVPMQIVTTNRRYSDEGRATAAHIANATFLPLAP